MKRVLFIAVLILSVSNSFSQNANEVLARVFKVQQAIKTVAYTLTRVDTLVTGYTRTMSGNVKIVTEPLDGFTGFKFWAKKDGEPNELFYDGHIAYTINTANKTYLLTNNPSSHLLDNYGGQILLADLVKLDTAKANGFSLTQDANYYYLTINYPDLKQYDVYKRIKAVKIDKQTMLPSTVRLRQETLGKVQDLYYEVKIISVNSPGFVDDFSAPDFIKTYQQKIVSHAKSLVMSLKDKPAPGFNLIAFDNSTVALSASINKVTLLDFWEVWCGPCMESMPKVERLYVDYKEKGLAVYGITNDHKQLDAARLLVKKKNIAFPTLIGTDQLQKDYKIKGVPLYVLIDKTGKIVFVSEGYSDELEAAIKKALI
jgi:thiol-disulfide isomerase/thioredoxin